MVGDGYLQAEMRLVREYAQADEVHSQAKMGLVREDTKKDDVWAPAA